MSVLTVVLALLAALSNATASVLQRRAAVDEADDRRGVRYAVRWLAHLLRRPYWLAGAGLLALSAVLQAWALSMGGLSLVQPLLASELLFTLLVGSLVFRRRPEVRTWLAFAALAVGLALFLGVASPSAGRSTAPAGRWLVAGGPLLLVVVVLVLLGRRARGAPRAALFGLASAVSFAVTAALVKEVVGGFGQGVAAVLAHWSPYATAVVGLVAFLLLQSAFRAGTLTASQPALTLGDAVTSVALGWVLFEEHIALGVRILPEVVGIALIGAGSVGLAGAPSVSGAWDTAPGADRRTGTSAGAGPPERR
ncbi:DMT family transporter [Streptomyces sp. TG1A-8]|uniref:DMT family transporter n=1 Tax=Streptomyces sp. TG1A-8 TaxID=3051385 RepID=UPI00265B8D2C|nr:DMT family transporter [Streptomyces sp. TG1A-8]MDO0924425.1 DMT family transporter [Streptomyces sp. TG1A-8]